MENSKSDISIFKLINYNLMFIIPLIIMYLISYYFSGFISEYLRVSTTVTTEILMAVLSLILFFILIPLLRIRESVRGVRFAMFNFVITWFVITIPSLINGDYNLLMSGLIMLGNFIFAIFINCPDVIGISGDPEDWFKHKAQVVILIIFLSIILLYVFGFAWMYYQMANDSAYPHSFRYMAAETPTYGTMIYYSFVTSAMVNMGEIMPNSPGARIAFSMQTFMGVIINLLFISTLMMYISYAQSIMQMNMEKKIKREEDLIERRVEEIHKENRNVDDEQEKKIGELEKKFNEDYEPISQDKSKYPNFMDGRNNLKR